MGTGLVEHPLIISLLALLVSLLATPLVQRLAVATGTVDRPSVRKIHLNPIPLLGGAAIYAAFTLVLLITGDSGFFYQLAGILVGATLVAAVGVIDDRWGLSPWVKLGAQVLAAITLIRAGVQVQSAPWPWLNVAITIVWVVAITNAFNLLDNMDGLTAGLAAIASAYFFMLAAFSGQYLVAPFAAALLGACLGFLRYNFRGGRPAAIFMGDGGSLFLGFTLAALGMKLRFANTPDVTWLIPIIVLGIPIFDTTLVTIARLRRGVNPLTTPGKDHVSHRLVGTGMTQREAVLTLYVATGVLGLAALYLVRATRPEGLALAILCAVAFAVFQVRFQRLAPLGGAPAPASAPALETPASEPAGTTPATRRIATEGTAMPETYQTSRY